ncbi:MAG: PHP domain-containing protein, partial [Oscillospiraceae bacterium]|nr:PHP domain-containing protein [Oscillospiraceae bacterium]
MAAKISELFDKVELSPAVADGTVLKLIYNETKNTLMINLALDDTVSASEILSLGNTLTQYLDGTEVSVFPKYHSSLFNTDYLYEIIAILKAQFGTVNGYLDNAEITDDGSTYEISLKTGGRDILLGMEIDKKIERYVRGFFGVSISVVFTGNAELDLEQVVKEEQSAPLPVIMLTPPPAAGENKYSGGNGGASRSGGNSRRPAVIKEEKEILLPFESEYFESKATLFYGKGISEEPLRMAESFNEGDEVTLWGEVFKTDEKTSRDGNTFIFTAYFSDKTSSEIIKIITPAENSDTIKSNIKAGKAIILTGRFEYDTFAKVLNIRPYSIASLKLKQKKDNAEEKRVELHMHTNMSDMDALTPAGDLVKQAFAWGHKAVAITDHGNVQAYPEAMNTVEKIRKDGGEMKVLYGMEAYFVNDSGALVSGCNDHSINDDIIVFDIETTGLDRNSERITEIGAVKLRNMEVVEEFQTFVNPEKPIPANITEITGITDDMVKDAPDEKTALQSFIDFAGNGVLVAHNADFDTGFIRLAAERQGIDYEIRYVDTLALCRAALPHLKKHKLDVVAKEYKLGAFNHHRAIDDAKMLSMIFQ